MELGPSYGYFPEPRKSYLVVALSITHLASDAFAGLGISVVCSHSFLGGVIGEATQCEDLIQLKVNGWVHSINALAKAAKKSPRAAFDAMAKSLQFEWSHVQKVVRNCGPMLQRLHDAIVTNFFPAIFDSDVSELETSMFFLPARMGGLGIRDPIDLCDADFDSSRDGVTVISAAIDGTSEFDWSEHLASLHAASASCHGSVNSLYEEKLHLILDQFPDAQQRAIKRAVGGGISHWLTTIPLERYHFDLAPIEFRDTLALRYLWTPPGLPSRCDGCEESFTLQQGLDCPKGGLIIRRHNKIRDCLGNMAALVWPQVIREPVVREGDPASDDPGLRLDLGIRGVWQPQVEASFDIRVIDTDAPSYRRRSPVSILDSGAVEKKRVYCLAVEDRRGNFTPFVLSVDGLLQCEASHFVKGLSANLASRWEKPLSDVLTYVRSRLLFASVRSASMCLRGSRIKWRSGLGFDDGAPLQFVIQ